ncbi:MAG: glycosyltransferase family 39 protein [Ruminococcus sp.]|nr:glycosyltransferase family 39 protein [Ruminococcus sp.]
MKNRTKAVPGEKAPERLLRTVIAVLMMFLMGILVIYSLLQTTDMTVTVSDSHGFGSSEIRYENFIFNCDSIIINLISLAAGTMLCFIAIPRMKKLSYGKKQLFLVLWIMVIGCIWVHSAQSKPSYDSLYVSEAGYKFAHDNYEVLTVKEASYFQYYPYQLGICFLYEIIFRIFGLFSNKETYLPIEYVNVAMLAVSEMLIAAINRRIFRDRRVTDLTFLLLMFCVPPILISNFTYGIIPGLMFALIAVYSLIRYFESNALQWLLFTFLPAAVAVMLKANCIIFVVAIAAVVIARMPERKKYLMDILLVITVFVTSLFIQHGVCFMYYERAGILPNDSVPFSSYIAMGLSDNPAGPGWNNQKYTFILFMENGNNETESKAALSEIIHKRIGYFARHPYYTRNFFTRKFLSQWNDTTYEGIWNSQVRPTYRERGALAEWVCGPGEYPMKRYMDKYAQIVFAAVLAGVVSSFRRKRLLELFFPLVILGGMLFHLISEAKSQYALPYFIMMSGYAAFGMCCLYDCARKKLSGRQWADKLFLFGTPAAEPVPERIAAAPAPLPAPEKEKKEKVKKAETKKKK